MASNIMGCFGGRSKNRDTKKRKIRYEGIEMGGKVHTLQCTTPMPEEQELNAMFAELVVNMNGSCYSFNRLNANILCAFVNSYITTM